MRGVWTKNLRHLARLGSRLQPATAESTACLLHRTASLNHSHFVILPTSLLARPLPDLYAALRLRARGNTKGQLLAEELPQRCNAARARLTHRPRALRQRPSARCGKKKRVHPQLHRPPSTDSHDKTAQALFRTKQGDHVQAETIAPHPTPRAGVPRYSLRSSAKTRTTVIRAAGSV